MATEQKRQSGDVVPFRTARPAEPDDPPAFGRDRQVRLRQNVAALLVSVILVLVGLWLAQKLAHTSSIEDCLMSGRTNCVTIDLPPRSD